MRLKKLKIRGFKSFSSVQELDLENVDSGLIFVTGKNSVEEKLGANGSGKSSLFEALSFCLYGKTSTNLKAGDIKNWFSDEPCEVSIEFEKNGLSGTIKRTWSPNTLVLNGKNTTQEAIDRIVGMNFDSFSYSVLISQFGQKFLDFTPSVKLEIFTNILEGTLKIWDYYIDYCSKKSKDVMLEKNSTALELSNLEGKKQTLDSQSFENEAAKWKEDHDKAIEKIQGEIRALKTEKETSVKEYDSIKEELGNKEMALKELDKKLEDSGKIKDNLNRKFLEINKNLSIAETKVKILTENIDRLNSVTGLVTCPTCVQPVNPYTVKREVKRLEIEKKELSKSFDRFQMEKKVYEQMIEKEKEKYGNIAIESSKMGINISSLIKRGSSNTLRREFISKELKSSIEKVEALKEEQNPYLDMGKGNKSKVTVLKRLISYKKNDIERLTQEYEIYQYWTKGFKDIKLMLTAEALEELEVEVNNNLQNLGLNDWKVKLSIDSETKSGTIRRGFSTYVKSPINESLVPFDCWSGGEGQRIRLAVTLGLVDFITNRRGTNWNILVLDEPTQYLSEQGISDLLKMLRDKANENNLKLFLIDHRNLDSYGLFSDTIEIEKTDKGSVIWN